MKREEIVRLACFADTRIRRIEPVSSHGHTHRLFRIDTDKGAFALRCGRESMPTMREARIQCAAASLKLAPDIVWQDARCQVMPWIEGTHLLSLDTPHLDALVDALRRLHRDVPCEGKPYDMAALVVSRDAEIVNALETLSRLPHTIAMCHHDLNPHNIIWQGTCSWFIDFEYAAPNDVCFDLASVCVEFGLNETQQRHMLRRYFGDMSSYEKLCAYKVLYAQLCREWFSRREAGV